VTDAPKRSARERVFERLESYASVGAPCPPNGSLVRGEHLQRLQAEGKIKVEYSNHGCGGLHRTVEILVGPHAGKRTAPPPPPIQVRTFISPPRQKPSLARIRWGSDWC